MSEAFIDASYAIALSCPKDRFHQKAVALARRVKTEGSRLVTTRAVVLEIGNALARERYRREATALLASLEDDPSVEIVPLTESLYKRGLDLFRQRRDKEWGLTDCISFAVMRERGLSDALTADEHFKQAGFRAMLLE
jgi:hypothetical protein